MASLSAHDFLLAAMVLCVELDLISSAEPPATAGPNQEKIGEMRGYIEKSYNIYKQPVNHYAQTSKALKAMEIILNKSKNASGQASTEHDQTQPIVVPIPTAFDLQQSLPTTLTLDPSFSYIGATTLDHMRGDTDYSALNNRGQDMDWQTWDTIVQNTADINNMAWSPEMGTDLEFLDDFVGVGMDPFATTNVVGVNDFLPPATSMGTSAFPPPSQTQLVNDTTPFWP